MTSADEKRRFFDEAAEEFAQDDLSDQREKIEWMLDAWNVQPGMTVLEPGCGAGQITVRLAEAVGEAGSIIALDISSKMIEEARRCLANHEDLGNRVTFHEGGLEGYDAARDSIDLVIAYRFFPHLEDIPAGLEVIAGALRPDGLLFIDHPAGREQINEFHERVGGAVSDDAIPDEDDLRQLLESAGMRLEELIDREELYHARARLIA